MATDYGKPFENKLKEDWTETVPESLIIRIPDQMSGFKGTSSNIADFIAFKSPMLFLIEAKSRHGNTFSLTEFKQYDKLLEYANKKDVYPGVVIWFIDHDKVIYAPITSIQKMKLDDKKSVNIKMLETNDYFLVDIPSHKKRVFLDSDYSVLLTALTKEM